MKTVFGLCLLSFGLVGRAAEPPSGLDAKMSSPTGQTRIEQFEQVLKGENSKPINVYGKVIDQYGKPVVGAAVKGGTLLYINSECSGEERFSTTTDAEGLFSFTGLHGVSFGFGPERSGYEYDPRIYLDRWNSYKPDPSNPAVIVMWKLQGAEPMLHTRLGSRVPYDGQTAAFDVLAGKKAAAGELRITLTRTPQNIARGADRFDWNVSVGVAGGGLVEATGLYKNLAPESSYLPALSFAQTKYNPRWTESLTKMFYVHLSKGQYGRVFVDLTMNSVRMDTGIRIESWITCPARETWSSIR